MPRHCTVCDHAAIEEINGLLLDGAGIRDIAGRFDLSRAAVHRHGRSHLPALMVKAHDATEAVQAATLLDRLRSVNQETLGVLAQAKRARDGDLRLRALARLERQIELEASLLGELQRQAVAVQVNIGDTPPDEKRVHQMALDIVGQLVNSLPPDLREQIRQLLETEWRRRRDAKLDAATAKMKSLMPPPQ